jgi:hypothetical protein
MEIWHAHLIYLEITPKFDSLRLDPHFPCHIHCMSETYTAASDQPTQLAINRRTPCSFGLSATSQQYFSLRTNQSPATSQQYFSLWTNIISTSHQPKNRMVVGCLPTSLPRPSCVAIDPWQACRNRPMTSLKL